MLSLWKILFKLSNKKACLGQLDSNALQQYISRSDPNNNSEEDNVIIINNSPIELGHILLLPQMYKCNKQVLNIDAVRLAIDVSLLTCSHGFFVGFNSINAYASVNHLHLHAYYLGNRVMSSRDVENSFPIPIQNVNKADQLANKLWFINDQNYFFPAFSVQLCDFDDDCEKFSK